MNTQQELFPEGWTAEDEAKAQDVGRQVGDIARQVFSNKAGPSHHNAPETSHQAALANAPRSGTQRARVLLAIHNFGYVDRNGVGTGLNDDEIANASKLMGNSVRPRRGELHQGGFIEDAGRRSSMLGNGSVVWSLTEKGRRAAMELSRD